MKILQYTCLWTRTFPLNFGSYPYPESEFGLRIRTPDAYRIRLGGGLYALIALVWLCFIVRWWVYVQLFYCSMVCC